ncbi:MAG: Holliday junction branch migration DNA helicase RuvB [Planctomycetota bacterium]
MTEEFPFDPNLSEDSKNDKSLRPRSLDEFVGQRRICENLRLAIEAAQARGEVLDHVLLSGMPGLGKTTLSFLVAQSFGRRPKLASGPNLERGRDVVGLLTDLERGDFLFIDEIHRMSPQAEEYLYTAMEDFCVDVMLDQGPDARTVRIDIEPFTLIGATTREGLLSAPLLSRFPIQEKLEFYDDVELDHIVQRSAARLDCTIDSGASRALAIRSRGTPRYANRFLRRIRDVAQVRSGWKEGESLHIGSNSVSEGLERLGIDELGLTRIDRKILEVLLADAEHAVGLKTIAASIGEEERTIEDVYEPHLIRQNLVRKRPRGRCATTRAVEVYGATTT